MRKIFSGIAVLALATAGATTAYAKPASMMMTHAMAMPKCTAAMGPIVWYVAGTKTYYAKGATTYGKGQGKYVCKATAAKLRGAHMGAMGAMMPKAHPMTGPATRGTGAMATPGAMAPGSMATPAPRAPGSMVSPGPMSPGSMTSPGTMASPGAMATPREQTRPGAVSVTPPPGMASPSANMGASPQPRPT